MDSIPENLFLEIRLEGTGIAPDSVPMATLARAFGAINRIVSGHAGDKVGPHEEAGTLRLTQVRRGSAIYTCAAGSFATPRLRLLGVSLSDPGHADDIGQFLRPLEELSQVARSLGCTIALCDPGENSAVLARIGGDSYKAVAEAAFIEGETEIAGTVKRVGGVKKTTCGLRVGFQHELLWCEVTSAEVARQLGCYLYQDVIVKGTATWIKRNWRFHKFKVREVTRRESGLLSDALAALRQVGGFHWDSIDDPQAFLDEVRGEA